MLFSVSLVRYGFFYKGEFVIMLAEIITLGCKVNQYESEAMLKNLNAAGFQTAGENQAADIIVVNSCAVTSVSESKARKTVRRARRENENAVIVLTGCVPQAFPDIGDKYPEADIILGNRSRKALVPAIEQFLKNHMRLIMIDKYEKSDSYEELSVSSYQKRTRAFIKIEDGCNRFCSYCIIPYARGRVRSRKLEDIKSEVEALAKAGYSEIVLVGINLSCYGSDIGLELCDAVDAVCNIEGIERVRLGSLEPELMSMDVLKRLNKQKKFCPQFHLSLQSGCDETLRRMNRKYTAAEYEEIVENIRTVFDNPSVTTDIMTGFPGESEAEFEDSRKFAEKIAFAKAHIFPYSRREGTAADKAPNQIPNEIKKERAEAMAETTEKSRRLFLQSQVGLVQSVLLETRTKNGMLEGYTENYTLVLVEGEKSLCGKIVQVRIESADREYCMAKIIPPSV